MTVKERIKAVVDGMPDDATYEQIVRELAFAQLIDAGMNDYRDGKVITDDEMKKRIDTWQK